MTLRPHWLRRIEALLKERSVLWLAGVRRVGKTTLCKSLPGVRYFDCELPRVRRELDEPESFFAGQAGALVVLDEIHRLVNPSEVLKIAADHFPTTRVIATGSSTLAARRKFRDTLAGRKHELWLTPAIHTDLAAFGNPSLDQRLLRGGLPPFLLGDATDLAFREWIDSYWQKDLQELFVVEKRAAFEKFMELLFLQSGALFEAQPFATACEVSRQTIQNYLQILETTLLMIALRPYAGASASELKSQPKVYAFDTGFVCYFRGLDVLRDDDRGPLLEHLVLGELLARLPRSQVYYWRDKQKHELDFVVKTGRGRHTLAIECKAKASRFDPAALASFRGRHPEGTNLVVSLDPLPPREERHGDLTVRYVSYNDVGTLLDGL